MMIEETSSVRYGRTTIEYGIRRSPRRTTVAVAVDPVEGVLLTAPAGVDVARLDSVVKAKAQWIVERLRLVEDGEQGHGPLQWITGESVSYLGRHYRLRVKPVAQPEEPALRGAWLGVEVDARLDVKATARAVEASVRQWFRVHAVDYLQDRTRMWATKAHVEVADVVVKDQQKRWASCDDKGTLRFNWRIIQAPMRLVDYVVAHEVVHLIHRDHNKAFWARLGMLMPDYERRKEELRKIGPRLEW